VVTNAILECRGVRGDLAVQQVGQHRGGIAVQGIAVAGAAGDVLPELVARGRA